MLQEFDRTIRSGLKTFSWFIYRITTPAMRQMFMHPRDFFRMKRGIMSLLAADVFSKTPIRLPLNAFKFFYYVTSVVNLRASIESWRQRRRAWSSRLDFVWKSGA